MIDRFDESIRQAEKNVIDLDRDLEYQETIVADLKRQGLDAKEAEMREWWIRGLLHKAKELVREMKANKGRVLEMKVHMLSGLTRGGASFAAAEKAVDAVFQVVGVVKDGGGSDEKAMRAASKRFKAVARKTGDQYLKKVAVALDSLDASDSPRS